jgi:hypothetical protein
MTGTVDVFDRSDPEDIDLDPETMEEGRHYFYGQERKARQAALHKKGYRVESRSEHGVRRLTDSMAGQQGETEDVIRNGDTILMSCPTDVWEEREERKARLTRARMNVPEASFRKKARQSGLKPSQIITDDKE